MTSSPSGALSPTLRPQTPGPPWLPVGRRESGLLISRGGTLPIFHLAPADGGFDRHGELCRGMLVVDRRDDASAYAPGANRAEVQRLLDSVLPKPAFWESTALPAQVEIEKAPTAVDHDSVWCVTDTPGPETLLRLLLKRVWGANLEV